MLSTLNDCFEQLQSPLYTRTPTADTEQGWCLGLQAEQGPAALSKVENWCKALLLSTVPVRDSTIGIVCGEQVLKKIES